MAQIPMFGFHVHILVSLIVSVWYLCLGLELNIYEIVFIGNVLHILFFIKRSDHSSFTHCHIYYMSY